MGKISEALELVNDHRRQQTTEAIATYAKKLYEPQLAEMEAENANLRQRLTLAEAERDKWQRWYEGVLGAKKMWFNKAVERAKALSMARRWARVWKQAAKNEREARHILQVLLTEYEAHGRIAPIPVAGTLTGRNAREEWQAIHAALGTVGERD